MGAIAFGQPNTTTSTVQVISLTLTLLWTNVTLFSWNLYGGLKLYWILGFAPTYVPDPERMSLSGWVARADEDALLVLGVMYVVADVVLSLKAGVSIEEHIIPFLGSF